MLRDQWLNADYVRPRGSMAAADAGADGALSGHALFKSLAQSL